MLHNLQHLKTTSAFEQCELESTLTFGSSGNWDFDFCSSGVPGTNSPTVDANLTDSNNIGFTQYSRGLVLSGLNRNDVCTLNGVFNTIELNGVSPTVNVPGQYGSITNNLTGSPSVTLTNAFKSSDVGSGGGGGTSVTVTPLTGAVSTSVNPVNTQSYYGESPTIAVLVTDANGDAVDFTAITLEVCYETQANVDVGTVVNSSISVSDNQVSWEVPAAVGTHSTDPATVLQWSLRNASNGLVYLAGLHTLRYTALAD